MKGADFSAEAGADQTIGRFAPSPTGPLHFGSLVAAAGSFLSARSRGGRWLVRMEDLDTPRVVDGAATSILRALERYGLQWDGEVVAQSARRDLYASALETLRAEGAVFDCACSRSDLQRAASAPAAGDGGEGVRYPGTCRDGAGGRRRAVRFRAPDEVIRFDDAIAGPVAENIGAVTGDFVLLRADGVFAYQLAVVVDDAAQGVTEVVRGGDLLESTPRQIALQLALQLPTPRYAHLPLMLAADGSKLGKRHAALPLETLDERRVSATLARALEILGCAVTPDRPELMLREAQGTFDLRRIERAARMVTES